MVTDGLTLMLQVPLPEPVVLLPPTSFSVNVQAPFAVIVPLIVALPLQMVMFWLVMAAVGLSFTVMVTSSHDEELQGEDS